MQCPAKRVSAEGADILYRAYKFLIYLPFLVLWTLVNFLGVAAVAGFSPRLASRWFGGLWGRGLLWAVPAHVRISGRENIDPAVPYVIVANHLSLIDIPLLYGWLPMDLKWIMKKEVGKIPLIGRGAAMLGHVFLDRRNHGAALRTLQQLRGTLQPGTSILFFAEGTRSRSGKLQAFKLGAFHMARDLDVPILPITIRHSDRILTPDSMELHPGSVQLVIHPPITRAEVRSSAPEELRDRSRGIIASALAAVPSDAPVPPDGNHKR